MINAYPQNNVPGAYGNAWWGIYPPNSTTPIASQSATTVPQTQPQQTGGIDGVAFVQGENAALAYVVPAGKTFLLMDTVEDRIYFKSADSYGRPQPLNDFWLSKTKPETAPVPAEQPAAPEYATKADIDELRGQIAELKAKKTPRSKKTEVVEEVEVDE